jgi:hypothetical protein
MAAFYLGFRPMSDSAGPFRLQVARGNAMVTDARFGMVTIVAGMLFGTGGLAAETRAEQVPTVEVLLVNHAAVPQADVADARAHAEEVFGSAGVRLVWTSAPGAMGTRRVVVFLLPFFLAPGDSARGGHHDVLGRATPSVARALVFADRVAAAVQGRPVRSGVALGQVLAHEIAHLLLPTLRHAPGGIMRAQLDFDRPLFVRFTRGEAALIRAGLITEGALNTSRVQ